jgi:mono/diheme cytochrome c family protein
MRLRLFVVAVAIVLAQGEARGAGDAGAGRELAARWCSQCHDISPSGRMKQQPPAFAAIAVYRSPEQIRGKIVYPHTGMPEYAQILGLDADDLTAYIVSLEGK